MATWILKMKELNFFKIWVNNASRVSVYSQDLKVVFWLVGR